MATAVLDSDSLAVTGAEITITTETMITLYVKGKTGTHGSHRIEIQISPDNGTTWIDTACNVRREGCCSITAVCTKARAKLVLAEGAISSVDVWLLAK